MKKFGETQIMGGSGEKPKGLGPAGKDFKQMFLEVIADPSRGPQERIAAAQLLKNVGFEINPDDHEKARIVIEQIQEDQQRHAKALSESFTKMKAADSLQSTETIEDLRKKISDAPPLEKPKHPVMIMPAVKPKTGQSSITPYK